jgi:hypothetical protein
MKHYPAAIEAKSCRCVKREGDEPFGDLREGTCQSCGHQVNGKPLPARSAFGLGVGNDHSTFAKPTRKFRPAA